MKFASSKKQLQKATTVETTTAGKLQSLGQETPTLNPKPYFMD